MALHNFNDPLNGGGLAPLQSQAVSAQAAAPSSGGITGGFSSFLGGNQRTVTAPNGTVTQTGSPGFFNQGGGASVAIGAIQTLGSLWNSFQQTKLAKKSINLQTRAFETNLANQTKTYNTALEDRINARYATEGRSDQAAAKIAQDRL